MSSKSVYFILIFLLVINICLCQWANQPLTHPTRNDPGLEPAAPATPPLPQPTQPNDNNKPAVDSPIKELQPSSEDPENDKSNENIYNPVNNPNPGPEQTDPSNNNNNGNIKQSSDQYSDNNSNNNNNNGGQSPPSYSPPEQSPTSGGQQGIDPLLKPNRGNPDVNPNNNPYDSQQQQANDPQSRTSPIHMLPHQAQHTPEDRSEIQQQTTQQSDNLPTQAESAILVEKILNSHNKDKDDQDDDDDDDDDKSRRFTNPGGPSSMNKIADPHNGRHHYVAEEQSHHPYAIKREDRVSREPYNGGTRTSQQQYDEYRRAKQRQYDQFEHTADHSSPQPQSENVKQARKAEKEQEIKDQQQGIQQSLAVETESSEFEPNLYPDTHPDSHRGNDKRNHPRFGNIGEGDVAWTKNPDPRNGRDELDREEHRNGHDSYKNGVQNKHSGSNGANHMNQEKADEIRRWQERNAEKHPHNINHGKANDEPREDSPHHHHTHKFIPRRDHINNLNEVPVGQQFEPTTPTNQAQHQPQDPTMVPNTNSPDHHTAMWIAFVSIGSICGLIILGVVLIYILKRCNCVRLPHSLANPFKSHKGGHYYQKLNSTGEPYSDYGATNNDQLTFENFQQDTKSLHKTHMKNDSSKPKSVYQEV